MRGLGLLGLGLAAVLSVGADPAAALTFPGQGFTIAPLEGPSAEANVTALVMMLPPTEGFAPNVNVMVQPYEGSLSEYIALSEGQFKSLKFSVKKRTKTKGAAAWEYTGVSGGQPLHWYARALKAEGKVYLVTATARKDQWDQVSEALRACVDSFALTGPSSDNQ